MRWLVLILLLTSCGEGGSAGGVQEYKQASRLAQQHSKPDNQLRALELFEKSALLGNEAAYSRARELYVNLKLEERGINFYAKRANEGDVSAIHHMGMLYLSLGEEIRAETLLYDAALKGHPRSYLILAGMAEQAGDDENAEKFMLKVAERGNPTDMQRYAELLLQHGKEDEALVWFEKSGTAHSLYRMGMLRSDPISLRKAADLGNPDAQYNYALKYLIPDAPKQAMEYLDKAVRSSHPKATLLMTKIYLNQNAQNLGVEPNYEKAFQYANFLAERGDREAMLILSKLYEQGLGVKADEREAKKWKRLSGHH